MTRLTGPQIMKLAEVLRTLFARADFETFLLYRLNRRLDDYVAAADSYPTVLRKVVDEANAKLWWPDLLVAARNAVPTDPDLMTLGAAFGLSTTVIAMEAGQAFPVPERDLERQIKKAQSTFDIAAWRKRLGEVESRVCRIEMPEGTSCGTGFLVGPRVILTAYHVLEPVFKNEFKPSEVRMRFDYKVLADGVSVAPGVVYGLADDWLIDHSLYSSHDEETNPSADPALDELDYALLLLEGSPGADSVGGETGDPRKAPRGWLQIPVRDYEFTRKTALYIVQHPEGKPMQLAIDSEAVLGLNGNGTRVRYTTTTEVGSSGSPCFAPNWDCVALHHTGDTAFHKPMYNQGIPLAAIRRLLTERKKTDVLGGP